MQNTRQLRMIGGLFGGGLCAFAGLICLMTALVDHGGAIPTGLLVATAFFFAGIGAFAAAMSLIVTEPTSERP